MKRGRILREERGQVLLISTLCLVGLVGVVGFAADVGLALRAKRLAQNVADSAALAGAAELKYGNITTVALAAAAQNGITHGANGGTITVNNPPASGPHSGNANYVEVIAYQSEPTFFLRMFGTNTITVSGRAVTHLGAAIGCVYTLDPTMAKEIWITGSGTISMPNCAIYDNSNDSSEAFNQTGSSVLSAAWIGVVGKASISKFSTISPTPTEGIAPVADPLAFLQAPTVPSSCTNQVNISGAAGPGTYLYPGCYSKFNISGSGRTITMYPGLYIVNGSAVGTLSITGSQTINGTGVTFYLTGGGHANVTGSGSLNLSAPTSGTYNGILFFEDRNYGADVGFNGSTGDVLNGIIYTPAATLTFNGSGSQAFYTSIVANALKITGSFTMNNYAMINSSTPITTASLAE